MDNVSVTATSNESLLVPEGARVLHIGPPKTGSTALQAAMHAKREEMQEYGLLHVASDQRGREAVLAALMDDTFDAVTKPALFRRWQGLLNEIASAGDRRVCLSNESMARVGPERARAMVESLGGERAHIVVVVRKLDRLLPSQWQEWVRLGSTSLPYEQWLRVVLGEHRDDPNWQSFWRPHDLKALVDLWVGLTAPERFTAVIADESDPQLLSRAFEQLLGLPDGLLKPGEGQRRNVSASMARVEVVRRLNEALEQRDWPADTKAALRSRVAKRIRSTPAWPGETPIPALPHWAATQVRALNQKREELVRSLGFQTVGDPANLSTPIPEVDDPGETADLVSAELAVDSVVTAIGGAVDLLGQQRAEGDRAVNRLRRRMRDGKPAGARPLSELSSRELIQELRQRTARRLRNRG